MSSEVRPWHRDPENVIRLLTIGGARAAVYALDRLLTALDRIDNPHAQRFRVSEVQHPTALRASTASRG